MRGFAILIMASVMLSAIAWPHEHDLVLRPTAPIPAVNVP
jgi:hypothetical protein